MQHSTPVEMKQLQGLIQQAKRIAVLTGAGVSAASGIPTFRGSGGLWRKYVACPLQRGATQQHQTVAPGWTLDSMRLVYSGAITWAHAKTYYSMSSLSPLHGLLCNRYDPVMLATPQAFVRDPSLVWEFYHWRREVRHRVFKLERAF
jgi:NAD-dependent SIR2 family protein deacetylase